ncbi:hypothetical protein FH972_024812 [Carpinus fangiana]|uniref:Uncharacterized protein n=1 Tax=Carpinus fangiana TaxID=176857 RepID=A0A5N6KZJ4_9ROSI|nr:hypothetical protein FH972_024812 [Carpinus fangiana]
MKSSPSTNGCWLFILVVFFLIFLTSASSRLSNPTTRMTAASLTPCSDQQVAQDLWPQLALTWDKHVAISPKPCLRPHYQVSLQPSDQATPATPLSRHPASPATPYAGFARDQPILAGVPFHQQAVASPAPNISLLHHGPPRPLYPAATSRTCGHHAFYNEQRVRRNIEPEDWLTDQRVRVVTGPRLPKLASHFCWLHSPVPPLQRTHGSTKATSFRPGAQPRLADSSPSRQECHRLASPSQA